MEITGQRIINAPCDLLFDALHDPAILRQVIPGCQRFAALDARRSEAQITLKLGPTVGTFSGIIHLYNDDPAEGFSLFAEADGGPGAGGANGNVHVALAAVDPARTNLTYHLSVTLRGRLAELPQGLLREKARTLAAEFFSRFDLWMVGDLPMQAITVRAAPAVSRLPLPDAMAPSAPAIEGAPGVPSRTPSPPVRTQRQALARVPRHAPPAPYEPVRGWAGDAPALPEPMGDDEPAPPRARWLLVALGVAAIAFLLKDSF